MSINKITPKMVATFKEYCEFDQDCRAPGDAMVHYQDIATKNANWPGRGTALGLSYIAGKLNGEAGEMAGQVFKAWRDDDLMKIGLMAGSILTQTQSGNVFLKNLTPERHAKIVKELGDVLWYVAAMASELDMTLSDVAISNLENLAGRTERGTLQGDGDR